MLRLLALALLLANGIYFAWGQGLLLGYGFGPKADQAPKECLQAGPFDEEQSQALRQTLRDALPADAWEMEALHIAPRWIVYLGKYASPENLAKKRAEIAAMGLKTESLNNPALEPGISLGGFEAKADAEAALVRLTARGLHTPRVVLEHAERTAYQLKLPAVGPDLSARLSEVHSALGGKPLRKCG